MGLGNQFTLFSGFAKTVVQKPAYASNSYTPGGLGGKAVLSPQPLVNWNPKRMGVQKLNIWLSALSPLKLTRFLRE